MKKNNNFKILAIETSCDETSAAVYDTAEGLLSNIVASQIDIHKKTGGVVPEVASRAHVEAILPVIDESLEQAGVKLKEVDYLAVTHAPGLIGSLLVGVNTAKSLSVALGKPLLPINHLEGHIYANFINEIGVSTKSQIPNPKFNFPAVILLVSGGHTSLILMKGHSKYKYLGETLDDAAGEAFDKVAKILGLEYPGGPNVSRFAEEYRKQNNNCYIDPLIYCQKTGLDKNNNTTMKQCNNGRMFPRSMLDSGDFNFSFSGLKTAVLYAWQKIPKSQKPKAKSQFAYEFEEATVDILATKTIRAAKKYKAKTVSICGGVAANKRLRAEIEFRTKKELPNAICQVPKAIYCGDNAAMIACVASYKLTTKQDNKLTRYQDLSFEVMSNKEL